MAERKNRNVQPQIRAKERVPAAVPEVWVTAAVAVKGAGIDTQPDCETAAHSTILSSRAEQVDTHAYDASEV
jgi:hypothetical protein